MSLKDLRLKDNGKMRNPARPVILYEMTPPRADNGKDWETKLTGVYHQLLQPRYASSEGSLQTASPPRPLAEQSTGHWN